MIEFALTVAADAAVIARPLAAWVETLRRELLDPIVSSMETVLSTRGTGSADPALAACDVGFAVEVAESLRVANYKYTNANWDRILRGLLESRWRTLKVNAWFLNGTGGVAHPRASMEFVLDLRGMEWPGAAQLLAVAVADDLAEMGFGGERQAALVGLVKSAARSLQADSGYLTRGESLLYRTPHEAALGVAPGTGVDFGADWLRGASWANLLSAEHLRKLGGRERVLREAPSAVVEELDERLVYLQVTQDLWGDFGKELGELAVFLEPALITKDVTLPQVPPSVPAAVGGPSEDAEVAWVRVDDALDPSSASFVLELEGRLDPDQVTAIDELVDAWGRIGLLGGFGGHFHTVSGRETVREGDTTKMMWSMDLGTAAEEGLHALTKCLAALSGQNGFAMRSLVVA